MVTLALAILTTTPADLCTVPQAVEQDKRGYAFVYSRDDELFHVAVKDLGEAWDDVPEMQRLAAFANHIALVMYLGSPSSDIEVCFQTFSESGARATPADDFDDYVPETVIEDSAVQNGFGLYGTY